MPVAIGPDGTEDGAENTPTTTTKKKKKKKKMMKMHITTQIFLLFQLPDTDTDTDTCRRSLGASASLGL
jgi:hypothetical protein